MATNEYELKCDVIRKVYFKEDGQLVSEQTVGFSGDDIIDTSEDYMNAAKVMVGGLGSNMACLVVIDGGKK